MTKTYLWKTVRKDRYDRWVVHGFDHYPRGSVLAGQYRKNFLDSYDSLEEAQEAHPDIDKLGNSWTDPGNSFDHLEG